jgi:tetratricopeptide (TPR) repeat protein
MPRICLFAIFTMLLLAGVAPATDKDKLRQAVNLPSVSVCFGIGFNSENGALLMGEQPAAPPSPEALLKTLTGKSGDAEVYEQLAESHGSRGQKKEAREASQKAVALYRQRLREQPQSGLAHARLGSALPDEQLPEAEALVRKAVQLAPADPDCWYALGQVLGSKALLVYFGAETRGDLGKLTQVLARRRLSPQELASGAQLTREIIAAADKVVELAPNRVESYQRRCAARLWWQDLMPAMVAMTQHGQGQGFDYLKLLSSPEYLADCRRMVELDPQSYHALGMLALAEVLVQKAGGNISLASGQNSKDKEHAQRALAEYTARLEKLTQSHDAKIAGGAWAVLGSVRFLQGDAKAAENHFRRVVVLQPANQYAWDFLLGLLAMTKSSDLVPMNLERIKQRDDVYTRYLLAKSYAVFADNSHAEEAVRAALKHDAKDYRANLGLAALLLRRSDRSDTLAEAKVHLDRTGESLKTDDVRDRRLEWLLLCAIHQGISGQVDDARRTLRQVLEMDPNNATARDVLAGLDE